MRIAGRGGREVEDTLNMASGESRISLTNSSNFFLPPRFRSTLLRHLKIRLKGGVRNETFGSKGRKRREIRMLHI